MLLAMNFSNLTTECYAAFALALFFSIVFIASMIYFFRNKKVGKLVSILTTMIFPFLAIFCWVYLILVLSNKETIFSLGIALACSAGYLIFALVVAALAYGAKHRAEMIENIREEGFLPELESQNKKNEKSTSPKVTQETKVNTQKTEATKTLLISHSTKKELPMAKETVEEKPQVKEEKVETKTVEAPIQEEIEPIVEQIEEIEPIVEEIEEIETIEEAQPTEEVEEQPVGFKEEKVEEVQPVVEEIEDVEPVIEEVEEVEREEKEVVPEVEEEKVDIEEIESDLDADILAELFDDEDEE
ncbi:MAG: hypothetical protein E7375_03485 [Clostridiales bacterium]|nr:hypothetical protein [Clostridiales bacterium]